jgi:cation transport protein ChaC
MSRPGDLWVFGYGSLMWRPGFPFLERHRARVTGLHRGFYVYSLHHRGLPARPGLVLGLDQGGVCDGVAYRVAQAHAAETVAYLRAREQVTGAYRETVRPVALEHGGESVPALFYVVERRHAQYTGPLDIPTQARIIRAARGHSGGNLDYLVSTVVHLRRLAIREATLERVLVAAGSHLARGFDEANANPLTRAHMVESRRRPTPTPRIEAARRARFLFRRNLP